MILLVSMSVAVSAERISHLEILKATCNLECLSLGFLAHISLFAFSLHFHLRGISRLFSAVERMEAQQGCFPLCLTSTFFQI